MNKLPPESEADFQANIIDLAHRYDWKVAHFRKSRSSKAGGWRTAVAADGAGYPDCTFAHEEKGALLIVEFKSQKGRLSPEQIMWGAIFKAIARVNILVFYEVWRPSDRPEIELFFKTVGR